MMKNFLSYCTFLFVVLSLLSISGTFGVMLYEKRLKEQINTSQIIKVGSKFYIVQEINSHSVKQQSSNGQALENFLKDEQTR